MIETIATAESNTELAPGYRLLTLTLREDVKVSAGQFAMLKPKASVEPLLRRALAVYRVHGPRRVSFLYQVLGRGTEALARVEPGGAVEVLLPLGNSWPRRNPKQSTPDSGRGRNRLSLRLHGVRRTRSFPGRRAIVVRRQKRTHGRRVWTRRLPRPGASSNPYHRRWQSR